MTSASVRSIDGTVCVVIPAGPDALMLSELLRWANAWRVRAGQVPLPISVDLVTTLRFACRAAEMMQLVPGGEQVVDPSDPGGEGWVTTTTAAAVLGISARGVRQRIGRGRLSARRVGSTWLVRTEDLKAS